MIISALTYYHCSRVHIDKIKLNSIDKKDNKKIKIKQYTINNACGTILEQCTEIKRNFMIC